MPLISQGDFIDVYLKSKQTGISQLFSKLLKTKDQRIQKTWSMLERENENWFSIPAVKKRWNNKITGNKNIIYQQYVTEHFLKNMTIKALSIGCGTGGKELIFKEFANIYSFECLDISKDRISEANQYKTLQNANNYSFLNKSLNDFDIKNDGYDLIMFDSSLHHLFNIHEVLKKVKLGLKSDGILLIFEYTGPNRFQYTKKQLKICNEILKSIPKKYRLFLDEKTIKKHVYSPGYLRMYFSDPSEAVESQIILEEIHKLFDPVHEIKLGGDLLCPLLKGISHHFMKGNKESNILLDRLFNLEDDYLASIERSDYTFGIYKKNFFNQ